MQRTLWRPRVMLSCCMWAVLSSKLLVVEFVHFLLHIICVFSSTVLCHYSNSNHIRPYTDARYSLFGWILKLPYSVQPYTQQRWLTLRPAHTAVTELNCKCWELQTASSVLVTRTGMKVSHQQYKWNFNHHVVNRMAYHFASDCHWCRLSWRMHINFQK